MARLTCRPLGLTCMAGMTCRPLGLTCWPLGLTCRPLGLTCRPLGLTCITWLFSRVAVGKLLRSDQGPVLHTENAGPGSQAAMHSPRSGPWWSTVAPPRWRSEPGPGSAGHPGPLPAGPGVAQSWRWCPHWNRRYHVHTADGGVYTEGSTLSGITRTHNWR